jgi:hypothetical protein
LLRASKLAVSEQSRQDARVQDRGADVDEACQDVRHLHALALLAERGDRSDRGDQVLRAVCLACM